MQTAFTGKAAVGPDEKKAQARAGKGVPMAGLVISRGKGDTSFACLLKHYNPFPRLGGR